MIRRAKEENLYKGFQVGANNVNISILQYADDTIFFGEAVRENLMAIKTILRTFELASRLKINFAKNSFGAFGQSQQWKQQAANYLHCGLLTFPLVYLGIPLGENPRRGQMWDSIIHKCERMLAKWKQRHISMGGE